jgi:Zn-dependent M16 (insulinase) family peptidase
MKGAFSSPEETLFRRIQESLFPDTSYSMESGGDPEVIPELSLEEFLNFHKKYYHPSNSYIYIYGNGDVMEQLKFIDEKYLKDFDRIDIDSEIKVQRAFEKQREIAVEYPISEDEDEKDNTFLSLNFAAGRATNPELYLGLEILEYMLLETPAAPLKKALLEAGLGKDVLGRIDNGILQPIFSVIVKNSNEDKKEEFQKVVIDTLEKLVQDGLDKKLVEASINIIEFRMREADFHGFPKGLFYYIKSMESWLYDSHPALHLEFDPTLEKVKAALTTDYFEDIIREYLLNNTHRSLLVVKPKKGLGEQKAEEVRKKLREHKQSLNMEEIRQIIENTEKLRIRQTTPDSPEALESIPMVSLEDISPKSEVLPLVEKEYSGIKVFQNQGV